jgi:uncharacterized BrkB/YihY/UPF0761 family membrane protein
MVWLVASAGFSFYVSAFGNYNKTYGSLAAVIVLMLWLYLTAFAVLLGAEIDSVGEADHGFPAEPAGTRNGDHAKEVAAREHRR